MRPVPASPDPPANGVSEKETRQDVQSETFPKHTYTTERNSVCLTET